MVTQVVNCGAFVMFNYEPPIAPLGSIELNGIHGHGARVGHVSTSYAVIEYNNPNNHELPASFNIHGTGHVNASTNTFFDDTVLRRTWAGAVSQPERGRTTAQLQNRAFLESQGWVF